MKVDILSDLWDFMKVRKSFWLLPLILVIVFFVGILIVAQGTVVAPFVYTLF